MRPIARLEQAVDLYQAEFLAEFGIADRARFERALATLTGRVGQNVAAATLAQGESFTIQQAVDRCRALE